MIRLLIADDSALMRRLLTDLFEAEGDFEVRTVRDGAEALAVAAEFKPDVITLDVQMPGMDGLSCLDRLMVERPTPVVMLSSLTRAGAEETVRALALGAVDVMAKPSGAVSLRMHELAPSLVEKVRLAAKARIPKTRRLRERIQAKAGVSASGPGLPKPARRLRQPAGDRVPGILVIGASTGGPSALEAVLTRLPGDFPWPVVVAQHMPSTFTAALASRLDSLCALTVVEVSQATVLRPGVAYIGRGEADLILGRRTSGLVAMAAPAAAAYRWHPSVDRLVDSAMDHVPAGEITGVLLTGMGNDGAQAMTRLRAAGGRTIAEAEDTAVIWGMPGELVRAGGAQLVLALDEIGTRLTTLASAA